MTLYRALCLALLSSTVFACGGGNGGSNNPPGNNPPPTGSNPCSSASLTAAIAPPDERLRAAKREFIDGDSRYNVLDALALHRGRSAAAAGSRRSAGAQPLGPSRDNVDVGEIAVVQDEGDLIAPPNSYDLRGAGVRFTRNGSGGYDARRINGAFRGTLGRQLTLTDDDSTAASLTFNFPFYDTSRSDAFINSDGNVTFGQGDADSTERNVARLLTGAPRVAPFLADLDPTAGGRIFVNAAADQYTVTWCTVRGFDSQRTITTQMTLLPDGTIEFIYGNETVSLSDAVIGVSPGRTGEFTPVNLSDQGPNGGSAAVGERFAGRAQLDNVAVLQKFYRTHPDNYDQILIWTDAPLIQDAFAYETTIANEVRGLGIPIFDASRDFGSGGRLRSYCVMDWINKYPEDPQQKFLGENTTVSVMGQEVGHRWLAFMEFRDHTGATSTQLLGRGDSHWSFFFDSDASVMEGNDIEDLGGGSFRTVGAVSRYSLLDQYAMGLVAASQVPPFFYVQSPTNVSPNRNRESAPQIGVTFNGTRRDVLVDDIIAVLGQRSPSASESARVHRQAFLFVSSAGNNPPSSTISKLDRIRTEWEAFFLSATDGRMRAITALR
jgi:hypothetical protein